VSWGIFRSSLRIIMQFTPEEIEIKKIACEIEKIHGVKNIHHVHVWQINDHDLMFEAHVDMSEDYKMSGFEKVLEEIKLILDQNGINHSTIQPEFSVDDKKQIIY
jgi:cobalt-zinc-cadmium efflux system protein